MHGVAVLVGHDELIDADAIVERDAHRPRARAPATVVVRVPASAARQGHRRQEDRALRIPDVDEIHHAVRLVGHRHHARERVDGHISRNAADREIGDRRQVDGIEDREAATASVGNDDDVAADGDTRRMMADRNLADQRAQRRIDDGHGVFLGQRHERDAARVDRHVHRPTPDQDRPDRGRAQQIDDRNRAVVAIGDDGETVPRIDGHAERMAAHARRPDHGQRRECRRLTVGILPVAVVRIVAIVAVVAVVPGVARVPGVVVPVIVRMGEGGGGAEGEESGQGGYENQSAARPDTPSFNQSPLNDLQSSPPEFKSRVQPSLNPVALHGNGAANDCGGRHRLVVRGSVVAPEHERPRSVLATVEPHQAMHHEGALGPELHDVAGLQALGGSGRDQHAVAVVDRRRHAETARAPPVRNAPSQSLLTELLENHIAASESQ